MVSKYYITTAIDYVNAPPHLGHAYEKIAADAIARYYRLRLGPDRVFFLVGTDEHGNKIEKAAHKAGVTPQEWVDSIALTFQDAWAALDISYDRFIRTTEPDHQQQVARIFARLLEQGDIYQAHYAGWYCRGCEEFKLERDLAEDRSCPLHLLPVEWTSEENYVFKLSRYLKQIKQIIETDENFLQPETRRREILNLLDSFPDVSVSRQAAKWGIAVPGDPDHVIYVWIDALSNYLTGIGYGSAPETFERWWPADLHVVGKDITKFHAIIWPALLLALGLQLPRQVHGHGWVLFDSAKMSKSTGNVVDPKGLAIKYGADAIRFYLLREVAFGRDGDFSYEAFEKRVNADLANNLGNALNRVLTFAERHFADGVGLPTGELENASCELLGRSAEEARNKAESAMARLAIQDALAAIWELLDEVNLFVDRMAPWTLAKQESKEPLARVVWSVLETLRVVAIMSSFAIPTLAARMWEQIGAAQKLEQQRWDDAKWGTDRSRIFQARKTGPIYPRIGTATIGKTDKPVVHKI